MKKIRLLWIGLLCMCISCQRVEKKCDAHSSEYNLRGEVKKVETVRVEYLRQDTAITCFNSDGNLELEVNRYGHSTSYTYDQNNRLVSVYTSSLGEGKCTINDMGMLPDYITMGDTINVGMKIEFFSQNDNGENYVSHTILYDKNRNRVFEGGPYIEGVCVYKYDSLNRLVSVEEDYEGVDITERTRWNEYGDVLMESKVSGYRNGDNEFVRTDEYEYEYDKFNNWVGRLVCYDKKERLHFSSVERNGRYYSLSTDKPVVLRYVYYEKRIITYNNGETTQVSENFIKNAEIKYQESEKNRNAYLERLEKETIEILEQRIKKEQEEELRRLIERQPIQLIETIRHGFNMNNDGGIFYILKGKFKNISQKTFVAADIYKKGARWDEIGNAHILIELNNKLYLEDKNGYDVLDVGFESPWRPSEEKVISLHFKNRYSTYVVAAATGNLWSAHFQYEPTECTLIIPIYLEDAQGYKLQEYLRFNILEDYKAFGKELENN